MKFKIFGTEIEITFLFVAFLSVFIYIDKSGLILHCLIASFFHETAHLTVMHSMSCKPKSVKFMLSGIQIVRGFGYDIKKDIIISFCGPLANLFLSAVFFINYYLYALDIFLVFSAVNLMIGVYNLLPFKGLDGGEILYLTALLKHDKQYADRLVKIIGVVGTVVIALLGFFLYFKNSTLNLSILIAALYFLFCSLGKF